MAEGTLDITFSSDSTPLNSEKVIAMTVGFAFRKDRDSPWVGQGQKGTLPINSPFSFNFFDVGLSDESKKVNVKLLVINFTSVDTSSPDPFDWGSPRTSTNPPTRSDLQSVGCNIEASESWSFELDGLSKFIAINQGKWQITLAATVEITKNGEQMTLTFSIDPEMQVTGGG